MVNLVVVYFIRKDMLFYWIYKRFRNFAAMKKIILSIGILLQIAALTGCDNSNSRIDYKVTCIVDNQLRRDSATLLVLEEEYSQLNICGATRGEQGTFTFSGQTDRPKVALIRWDNDSTSPFYFVLEGGNTRITIKPGAWNITGSAQNAAYMRYIRQRDAIIDARVATWQEYLKMSSDSSLRHEDEILMVRQDSLLNDSLQRITVERINRGDAVARIIRERYGPHLDQEHMRQLK